MADFPISSGHGAPKRSRKSPRIDFTPMVDLGFLLITFFMLSTTLNKPHIMPLVMPDDKGDVEPTKASRTLTLLLGDNDKVYWYEGLPDTLQLQEAAFDPAGLRAVILDKMTRLQQQAGMQTYADPKTGEIKHGSFVNVLIKPCKDSRYKNLVDALDEMNICHVRYYCILEPIATELAKIP